MHAPPLCILPLLLVALLLLLLLVFVVVLLLVHVGGVCQVVVGVWPI